MTRSFKLPQYALKAGFTCGRNGYLTERHRRPKPIATTPTEIVKPVEYPTGPQDASEILRVTKTI